MRLTILILIILLFCSCACSNTQSKQKEESSSEKVNIASILISDSTDVGAVIGVRDIGKLKHGEIIAIKFAIENGFEKALVVNGVSSTCGCVSVDYKPLPLKKGESMVFDLTYNSQNRFGTQFANTIISTNFGDYIYRIDIFVQK